MNALSGNLAAGMLAFALLTIAHPADAQPRALLQQVTLLSSLITAGEDDAEPAADEEQGKGSSLDTLDDELLKGLDDELFEGLELDADRATDEPAADEGTPDPQRPAPGDKQFDDDLLRELGGDIRLPDDDPLSRVARQMREVEKRISQKQSDDPTQRIQQRIIQDLDQLIEQARKQAQQSMQAQASAQQGARRSQPQQPGENQAGGDGSGQADAPREGPARDSSERLGEDELRRADMVEMNELLKNLWGHLPERDREQVIHSTMEQFVPKYELMIEEYFKRLVEERSGHERR